jgi:short-chain fatty acids transporter
MNPLERIAQPFVVFVERFYPDAFVFAILLSLVAFAMAVGMTGTSAAEALNIWGLGLTGLLSFIAQLSLTLICAHALAHTDLVKRGLKRLATWPRRSWQGYFMVSVVAGLGSLFAWSLGLVVGALIAVEVAREGRARGLALHFPLLVASAYGGFVVWHMGYSSSAALFVATPGHSLEAVTGLIPVTETIFTTANVVLAMTTILIVAGVCSAMAPQSGPVPFDGPDDRPEPRTPPGGSIGERLENARWISLLMGAGFLAFLVSWFAERGLSLTLDIVNWSFLGLGLLLARSALHYVRLVGDASRAVGPIILQYPFYAGIMALMTQTDLVNIISGWFVAIASTQTLGFWAFIAGGVLNFFIPSGGGQWAVQGPIFIEAARQLAVADSVIVMAVAYGDQWSNMIQPFWTLPMLAIVGLSMRAIMGYCFVVFLVTFVLFGGALLLIGPG